MKGSSGTKIGGAPGSTLGLASDSTTCEACAAPSSPLVVLLRHVLLHQQEGAHTGEQQHHHHPNNDDDEFLRSLCRGLAIGLIGRGGCSTFAYLLDDEVGAQNRHHPIGGLFEVSAMLKNQ